MIGSINEFLSHYPVLLSLVRAAILTGVAFAMPLGLVWVERKVAGYLQSRLGPMHTGPVGVVQTVADTVKLLFKEDTTPTAADRRLFHLAPYIAFVATLLSFMVLPFAPGWVALDMNVAVVFLLGVSLLAVVSTLMAGWASNNKYSLLGGMRAVAQLLSYEIPMTLAVLCVVFHTGTMKLTGIVEYQLEHGWNVIANPLLILAFLLFFISALAEVNRTPFDLPEAESELVSGFNTEYSGMRFAMFFASEFANNFFVAALAVTLFFGGWSGFAFLPPVVWFLMKAVALVVGMMWIRWTLPRLRIDQLLRFAWQALVPAGLVLLMVVVMVA